MTSVQSSSCGWHVFFLLFHFVKKKNIYTVSWIECVNAMRLGFLVVVAVLQSMSLRGKKAVQMTCCCAWSNLNSLSAPFASGAEHCHAPGKIAQHCGVQKTYYFTVMGVDIYRILNNMQWQHLPMRGFTHPGAKWSHTENNATVRRKGSRQRVRRVYRKPWHCSFCTWLHMKFYTKKIQYMSMVKQCLL